MLRFTVLIALCFFINMPAAAHAEGEKSKASLCDKATLSISVQDVSDKIKKMKVVYSTAFKKKLGDLKQKNGWNDKEFLKKATPYISNDKIQAFQAKDKKIIADIAGLSSTLDEDKPDCTTLVMLNSHLNKILENTREKWEFMFKNIQSAF